MMEQMTGDDGGNRGHGIGLEQSVRSPVAELRSLGSTTFMEPMHRHPTEDHAAADKRQERKNAGLVRFYPEPNVPDVGGLGWRTKSGHLLKNQAFYNQRPGINKWDQPTHAGINTWKEWHGPKTRADADAMERLDRFDQEQENLEAKKTFVNTTRVQTLDRFYNRKLERSQLESAASWAPHRHAHRQVHSIHETFEGGLDEKPEKQLKKVLTAKVLERDREAVRTIADRIQKEETWKMVWSQMEQERREDIRADLQARQAHTDRLMLMSGQPVRPGHLNHQSRSSSSVRGEELAKAKRQPKLKDVTCMEDFKGLIHTAHNEHVLEALFPGSGLGMSVEFRSQATQSSEPGWPPGPRAETPRRRRRRPAKGPPPQEENEHSLFKPSIPVPRQRLERIGSRSDPDLLSKHAKVQFLPTTAPPALDQKKTLLNEDWTPSTTLNDASRVTGSFARTDHGITPTSPTSKAKEHMPVPRRSYVYPVIAESSPARSPASQHAPDQSTVSLQSSCKALRHHDSAPALLEKRRKGTSESSGTSSDTHQAPVTSVCQELDAWEANLQTVPGISNFFGTPRASGGFRWRGSKHSLR